MFKKIIMITMLFGLFSVPCFANPVLDDVLEEATSGNIEYYSVDSKEKIIINEIKKTGIDYKRAVQISNYIIEASEKTGIDALFIASVVKVDSNFRPSEENFYNSVGLMNIPVAVMEEYQAYDDRNNILQGARLLVNYRNRLKENEYTANKQLVEKILASYYGGLYYGEKYNGQDKETAIYINRVISEYDTLLSEV